MTMDVADQSLMKSKQDPEQSQQAPANNCYASEDDDQKSTATTGGPAPESIEVKVVSGGPVTALFQARTELRFKDMSFS